MINLTLFSCSYIEKIFFQRETNSRNVSSAFECLSVFIAIYFKCATLEAIDSSSCSLPVAWYQLLMCLRSLCNWYTTARRRRGIESFLTECKTAIHQINRKQELVCVSNDNKIACILFLCWALILFSIVLISIGSFLLLYY